VFPEVFLELSIAGLQIVAGVPMRAFFIVISVFFFFSCSCSSHEQQGFSSLDENGDKYKALANSHMTQFLSEYPVDHLKFNGKQMYVILSEVLPDSKNQEIARKAAVELNKFKNKTLRYRGVVVYCKNSKGTVVMARAE